MLEDGGDGGRARGFSTASCGALRANLDEAGRIDV